MYKKFEYILIAVEVKISGEKHVFVNPGSYVFEDCDHYGYVLADKLPDIEELESFTFPEEVQRGFLYKINIIYLKFSLFFSKIANENFKK